MMTKFLKFNGLPFEATREHYDGEYTEQEIEKLKLLVNRKVKGDDGRKGTITKIGSMTGMPFVLWEDNAIPIASNWFKFRLARRDQIRNLRLLAEGGYLTLSVQETGSLVVRLAEFRQYLREPNCEEKIISLCKAFFDIEFKTSWRMTIAQTPPSFSVASPELTEWITLVGDEDRFSTADRWFRLQYGKEDPIEDLIKFGWVVFTKDKIRHIQS